MAKRKTATGRGGKREGAGRPMQGESPKRTASVSLSAAAWERAEAIATATGKSRSAVIEAAIKKARLPK